jgi:hypothetical protein
MDLAPPLNSLMPILWMRMTTYVSCVPTLGSCMPTYEVVCLGINEQQSVESICFHRYMTWAFQVFVVFLHRMWSVGLEEFMLFSLFWKMPPHQMRALTLVSYHRLLKRSIVWLRVMKVLWTRMSGRSCHPAHTPVSSPYLSSWNHLLNYRDIGFSTYVFVNYNIWCWMTW